jgi:hypothetical protein
LRRAHWPRGDVESGVLGADADLVQDLESVLAEALARVVGEAVGAVVVALDALPATALILVCREPLGVARPDRAARGEDLDLAAAAADGVAVGDLGGAADVDVEDLGDGPGRLVVLLEAGRGM